MAKCEICGKGPQYGHNVSHSMVKTNRRWAPNVHKVTVVKDGVVKRMSVCTQCLRTLHKTS